MDYSKLPKNDVLCIDMRSFYASVEAVKRGLDPLNTMLAVVGDLNREGSIVLAMTPPLKEKYHLSNTCRLFELPKNEKNLIIAPAKMNDYLNTSLNIIKLLHHFAPKEAIHPYSIDEVWLTANNLQHLFGPPLQMAKKIQNEILQQFNLPSSIGIGDNKFLAKVALDLYAKKEGIAECRYRDVAEKLWPIHVKKIWGIGSRYEKRLHRLGITHVKDLALYNKTTLKKHFGAIGEQLYWHAWGVDLSPVLGNFVQTKRKGFGHGMTLLKDYSKEDIQACILDLCEEVCQRARKAHLVGKTVQLSIDYSKSHIKTKGFSRRKTLPFYTNLTTEVYEVCIRLLEQFYDGKSFIRYVSVSLTNLTEDNHLQLDLFSNRYKTEALYKAVDFIKEKYGPNAILRGSSLTKGGVAKDRSKKIGGHFM